MTVEPLQTLDSGPPSGLAEAMAAPREATLTVVPAAAPQLDVDRAIAGLRLLQTQYDALKIAEEVLLHLVDARRTIAELEHKRAGLLDEIGRLEQRHQALMDSARAAEQAARVRLEAIEAQAKGEEERLAAEKARLEGELQRLRDVIGRLSASVADLKM